MNSNTFQSRWEKCQAMAGLDDPTYQSAVIQLCENATGSGASRELTKRMLDAHELDARRTWAEAGPGPLDRRLAAFSKLYLEANSQQREIIRKEFKGDQLRHLIVFVDRTTMFIKSSMDTEWLRLGLAAAGIDGGRYDVRELIAGLSILRFGAERVGIEVLRSFDEAIEMSPEISDLLERVRDSSRETVKFYVRKFGPPDWAVEAKPWWRFW